MTVTLIVNQVSATLLAAITTRQHKLLAIPDRITAVTRTVSIVTRYFMNFHNYLQVVRNCTVKPTNHNTTSVALVADGQDSRITLAAIRRVRLRQRWTQSRQGGG